MGRPELSSQISNEDYQQPNPIQKPITKCHKIVPLPDPIIPIETPIERGLVAVGQGVALAGSYAFLKISTLSSPQKSLLC